ncbi:NAD(P)/FAD-dependent oxidoreductase [Paenibacillus sp. YPG26]|uniref:NAD(P)/FAD-dependent oxidoreductase n=1 Tax=Paenibacillus sp. YPG26 TaxID=2878915 RepID=UPI00203B4F09|nr:NAD(P)/FAD-dependent oxidoreductase [Paenibacillus sp. YPG26]USB32542.1 NAD(P)/FAD-dependent oxidoreductase [Paenibacillus sp. YPG26]
MKHFVILGGGYGGVTVANTLLKGNMPSDIRLTMIDRMPYQTMKTEYYALAAGTASDVELRVPFPVHQNLNMKYGEVVSVDLENKKVIMENDDPVYYDQLVIALGCTDRFHGIPGAEEYACTIQSMSAVRQTYRTLNDIKPYGRVNIVGGGLSGVEVAAELRESRPDLNIALIDRGSRVLSAFPPKMSAYVEKWFHGHDVETLSHISISSLEPGVIHTTGDDILSDATVWTAGIQPVEIVQKLNVPKDHQGRVLLNEYYQIPEHPEVYVCGDCASLPFAPSGQAAEGQGEQIAHIALALWRGEVPRLSPIKLKGTLGSLGKKAGFGLMGKRQVMGRVPRILKSGVLWMSKHHLG